MKKRIAAILSVILCFTLASTAYALSPVPDEPTNPEPGAAVQPALAMTQCRLGETAQDILHVQDGDIIIRCFAYTNLGDRPWSGTLTLADPAMVACDDVIISGGEQNGAVIMAHVEDLPAGKTYRILTMMTINAEQLKFTDWRVTGSAYGDNNGGACAIVQDTYFGDPDVTAECCTNSKDLIVEFRNNSKNATGSAPYIRVRIAFPDDANLDNEILTQISDNGGALLEDGQYEFLVGSLSKGGHTTFTIPGLLNYTTPESITAVYGMPGEQDVQIPIAFFMTGEPPIMDIAA